jgi:hypothetical protein
MYDIYCIMCFFLDCCFRDPSHGLYEPDEYLDAIKREFVLIRENTRNRLIDMKRNLERPNKKKI